MPPEFRRYRAQTRQNTRAIHLFGTGMLGAQSHRRNLLHSKFEVSARFLTSAAPVYPHLKTLFQPEIRRKFYR
jgi:hypothetical protein